VPRGISIYAEGTSVLHRAHPLTKGTFTLVAIVLAFVAPSLPWVVLIALVIIGLLLMAGVAARFLPVAIGVLLPITILLLLVQGFANPANRTVFVSIGPVAFYREGLAIAVATAARVFCLVGATFLLTFTTRPPDLAEALMQRGLSPRFGYVVQAALQMIPQSLESADRIRDAQRARGLETEGSLIRRARAYLPLLLPLVLSSLVATQERAMALEVRGFGLKVRRYPRIDLHDTSLQRILRWLLIALVPLAIVARFAGWR
jgi:energy-coupling factor transport system permease protein